MQLQHPCHRHEHFALDILVPSSFQADFEHFQCSLHNVSGQSTSMTYDAMEIFLFISIFILYVSIFQ